MNVTAEQIKGSVYGSFFFTGFGSWWLWNGWSDGGPWLVTRVVLTASIAIALLLTGLLLLRRADRMPSAPPDTLKRKRMYRVFGIVNLVQWLAVFAAGILLNVLHRPAYIAPAIALIVGLHLFPLARLFGYSPHFLTGTALVVWSVGCCCLLPTARLPAVVCAGSGVILLGSAAAMLVIGHKACGSWKLAANQAEA